MNSIKSFLCQLFLKAKINTGRQIEVDLSKAICVIGMIFVHVFENFNYSGIGNDTGVFILLRIGNTIFGASLFMFCMGLGMNYTKKNAPENMMLRGLTLFVIGILLNFFRAGLLLIIGRIMDPSLVLIKDIIYQIFQVDILIFAGLSLILFGALRKIRTPIWVILIVSIAFSIVGTIFNGYDLGNEFLNCLVGLFIGTTGDIAFNTPSCFPLCNWFIIVVVGYLFAEALKRTTNKNYFYLIFSSVALVAVSLYIAFCIGPKIGYFQDEFKCTFHIATYDALISICGAILALGFFYFISRILPKFILSGATSLAKNTLIIYCVQWLIIANATVLMEGYYSEFKFEQYQLVLIALGILIISILLAFLIKAFVNKRKINKEKTKVDTTEIQ